MSYRSQECLPEGRVVLTPLGPISPVDAMQVFMIQSVPTFGGIVTLRPPPDLPESLQPEVALIQVKFEREHAAWLAAREKGASFDASAARPLAAVADPGPVLAMEAEWAAAFGDPDDPGTKAAIAEACSRIATA